MACHLKLFASIIRKFISRAWATISPYGEQTFTHMIMKWVNVSIRNNDQDRHLRLGLVQMIVDEIEKCDRHYHKDDRGFTNYNRENFNDNRSKISRGQPSAAQQRNEFSRNWQFPDTRCRCDDNNRPFNDNNRRSFDHRCGFDNH